MANVTISIRVDEAVLQQVDSFAKSLPKSRSALLNDILQGFAEFPTNRERRAFLEAMNVELKGVRRL